MKRIFYILFAFYFAVLVFTPCGDKDNCSEVNLTTTQSADHSDHEDEACTPFCVCSCCAAHFVMSDFNTDLEQIAVINTVYTQHQIAETTPAIIPVWQPPKLA